MKGTGQGLMFFAYGEEGALQLYLNQALNSGRRIRRLNPSINMTLVTNPDAAVPPEIFDVILRVKPADNIKGKVPPWKASLKFGIQWMTRLEYLAKTPYTLTLALDSQALCCSSNVDAIFDSMGDHDVAFASRNPHHSLHPYNWAIIFRSNRRVSKLFARWTLFQQAYSSTSSDQGTLYTASGTLA
ncbi:unnamed protein product, partial [Phaeothamnion confervicola]